jgi:hypothetical protein
MKMVLQKKSVDIDLRYVESHMSYSNCQETCIHLINFFSKISFL